MEIWSTNAINHSDSEKKIKFALKPTDSHLEKQYLIF